MCLSNFFIWFYFLAAHLEFNNSPPKEACGVNNKNMEISPYVEHKTPDVGEKSIEAPAYSPLTPRQICSVGEWSVEMADIISPLPFEINPTVGTSNDLQRNSPCSSPIPDMSPETSKVFHMLIGTEVDSDDSVADPNYKVQDNDISSDDTSEIARHLQY